jgi:uncharacterized protein (TIGR02145 family)
MMKSLSKLMLYQLILLVAVLSLTVEYSCKKEIEVPSLITTAISDTTLTTAKSGGNITSDGGSEILVRGVCWSTSPNPTIDAAKTADSSGIGSFISSITGLEINTTYYVRAYATNRAGTGYGSELTFKTKNIEVPLLTTTSISDTSLTTAKSGGNVISDGGSPITVSGICWSTNQNPTTESDKTTDGTVTGSFICSIKGLTINTTYYLRAYATNGAGTGYGNILSFKTQGTVYDIDSNLYHAITIGAQIWMAENLKVTSYNDGTDIPLVSEYWAWAYSTTPGYCWYNNEIVNNNPYGAMYNWYAVSTGKLCPEGWHVPSDNEWTVLTNYLGGLSVAAGKLKETGVSHWNSPNSDATNESKFTAVPGGYRRFSDGSFFSIRDNASYWSSTSDTSPDAWSRAITLYGTTDVRIISNDKSYGISIRCIKDKD